MITQEDDRHLQIKRHRSKPALLAPPEPGIINFCCFNHPVYGILIWQPKLSKNKYFIYLLKKNRIKVIQVVLAFLFSSQTYNPEPISFLSWQNLMLLSSMNHFATFEPQAFNVMRYLQESL